MQGEQCSWNVKEQQQHAAPRQDLKSMHKGKQSETNFKDLKSFFISRDIIFCICSLQNSSCIHRTSWFHCKQLLKILPGQLDARSTYVLCFISFLHIAYREDNENVYSSHLPAPSAPQETHAEMRTVLSRALFTYTYLMKFRFWITHIYTRITSNSATQYTQITHTST